MATKNTAHKIPKTKYVLTDEHRAQLKPWADKWVANAMSTIPMTSNDKLDCIVHAKKLYKVAGLTEPTHVLFVKSPFALVVAGGFAAAIFEMKKEDPDLDLISIPDMVKEINSGSCNTEPNLSQWYVAPYNIRKLSEKFGLGDFGVECVRHVHNMWNGGNQWSGWVSYLSFFRYVAKLNIDYTNWDPYEKLSQLSGPRVVHEDFCIISDRPSVLAVNGTNQPHNPTGPFAAWSDGGSLYSVNNVRIPAYVIETPEKITVDIIEKEANLEIRRVMIDQYGREKFILDSKSQVIHTDDFGTLYRKELAGDEPLMMVKVVNSTAEPDGSFKDYFIRVSPSAYGGLKTARAAVASTWRKDDGSMLFENPEDYVCEIES